MRKSRFTEAQIIGMIKKQKASKLGHLCGHVYERQVFPANRNRVHNCAANPAE